MSTNDHDAPYTPLGKVGRIAGASVFAFLAAISSITAAVGTTESFATKPEGRVVAFVFFAAIGIMCSWFAIRLLTNRPRRDGGLMPPLALRCTAVFFIGLPIASLATGAWRNNGIPPLAVVAQGVLYVSWGIRLWRLAKIRSNQSDIREVQAPSGPA